MMVVWFSIGVVAGTLLCMAIVYLEFARFTRKYRKPRGTAHPPTCKYCGCADPLDQHPEHDPRVTEVILYSDNDPKVCAWVAELVKAGEIPRGDVLCKSITEIQPDELKRYTQFHAFCGIAGWPLALKLAGWPETEPVWTGSCPCQPFSVAGKGMAESDERHLWPYFRNLIGHCRPATVFGEQVASPAGRKWLAGVRTDLEGMGYAVGGADLCAAGVGAPHKRQRLYWVADSSDRGTQRSRPTEQGCDRTDNRISRSNGGTPSRLVHSVHSGLEGHAGNGDDGHKPRRLGTHAAGPVAAPGESGGMADAAGLSGPEQRREPREGSRWGPTSDDATERGGFNDFWSDAIWHPCRDGKSRRIPSEPALFPLAHGLPGRVGLLRGAGNSIVPELAAEFVQAYLEARAGK